MNPEPFLPIHKAGLPNCLALTVTLRGAPGRRERRAFFRRLHAQSRSLGLVVSHKLGLCIFFGAETARTSWHRHEVLNWLVDQQEVRQIDLSPMKTLRELVRGRLRVTAADGHFTPNETRTARAAVSRLAMGAAMVSFRQVCLN